jgi:hypothetical protein
MKFLAFVRSFILVFLLSLTLVVSSAQTDPAPTVVTFDARSDELPQVTVDLAVYDNGRFASGLGTGAFAFGNADAVLNVETIDTSPITLLVVIEPPLNNLSGITSTLRTYFTDETYYREIDEIAFYIARSDDNPRIITRNSREEILDSISTISTGVAPTYRFDLALRAALDDYSARALESPVRALALVDRPTYLPQTTAELGNNYGDAAIPLDVIHFSGSSEDAMRTLANNAGGRYLSFNDLMIRGGEARGQLESFFDAMQEDRRAYRVTYTTNDDEYAEVRTDTVRVTVGGQQSDAVDFAYEPVYQAPEIEITTSTSFDVRRTLSLDGTYDRDELQINGLITYPDGARRQLTRAELQVFDPQTDELLGDPAPLNISPGESNIDTFSVDWNLRIYPPGTNQTVGLVIQIEDEAGNFVETNPEIGSVTVIEETPPTATPTPIPSPTPVAAAIVTTPTVMPSPTPVPTATPLPPSRVDRILEPIDALNPLPVSTEIFAGILLSMVLIIVLIIGFALVNIFGGGGGRSSSRTVPATGSPSGGGGGSDPADALDIEGTFIFGDGTDSSASTGTSEIGGTYVDAGGTDVGTDIFMPSPAGTVSDGTDVFDFDPSPGATVDESGSKAKLVVVEYFDTVDKEWKTVNTTEEYFIHEYRNEYILGKEGSDAHAQLDYRFVSGQHASILHRGIEYFLVDDNSTNGTYLNDAETPLPPNRNTRLQSGDIVNLGNGVKLRFEDLRAPAEPYTPPAADSPMLSDETDIYVTDDAPADESEMFDPYANPEQTILDADDDASFHDAQQDDDELDEGIVPRRGRSLNLFEDDDDDNY